MASTIFLLCNCQRPEDRINAFEMENMEDIILSIAKKELKHIERLGGILGGLIGLIQGIIVIMIR